MVATNRDVLVGSRDRIVKKGRARSTSRISVRGDFGGKGGGEEFGGEKTEGEKGTRPLD